jgi:hypothetical protein
MPNISQLRQNRLLSALSPATQKRLLQHMESVELVLKETLTIASHMPVSRKPG